MVADDNAVNMRLAVRLLERLGCRVESAYNGAEAVAHIKRTAFDLVLMDCSMPEMDGFDATRAVRVWEATENRGRTPIVALTADAMQGDRERCLAAGMDEYLSKPLRDAELKAVLTRLLSRQIRDSAA